MSSLTLPRREFLKAGGAMVIGFSMSGDAARTGASRRRRHARRCRARRIRS